MIAIDTNVLLRLVLRDDPRQTAEASALLERAAAAGDELFVTDVVLCETMWVLRSTHRVRRPDLEATLRDLLKVRRFAFQSPDAAARALAAFAGGRGDFADYFIREHAREAGCEYVATFDRALLREDGFRAP